MHKDIFNHQRKAPVTRGAKVLRIAGMSRSQHRSQGMGSAERPGAQKNTLETLSGDKATADIFEGIDISWNRVPGGARVAPSRL